MSEISITMELNADGLGIKALKDSIVFKVFDSRMKFVGEVRPNADALKGLSPGAYKISADLPNGEEREKLVVLGDDPVSVAFDYELEDVSPDLFVDRLRANSNVGRFLEHRAFSKTQPPIITDQFPTPISFPIPDQSVTLQSLYGAEAQSEGLGVWQFVGTSADSVSIAEFDTPTGRISVSLPITWAEVPLKCSVYINRDVRTEQFEVRVEVSSHRPLVRSMLNLLDTGRTHQAGELAENASELLFHKYSDPVGATLGGLILFQLGRLNERPLVNWAQNLFQNFLWITDVGILKVATNTELGTYDPSDFDLLLSCAERPVLFTKVYSMLIRHLRSWEGELTEVQQERRITALERLADVNTRIDWSAPTVVIRGETLE